MPIFSSGISWHIVLVKLAYENDVVKTDNLRLFNISWQQNRNISLKSNALIIKKNAQNRTARIINLTNKKHHIRHQIFWCTVTKCVYSHKTKVGYSKIFCTNRSSYLSVLFLFGFIVFFFFLSNTLLFRPSGCNQFFEQQNEKSPLRRCVKEHKVAE